MPSYELIHEIANSESVVKDLIQFPPFEIFVHVYRAVPSDDGYVECSEGKHLTPVLSEYLKETLQQHTELWSPPKVLFGADLSKAFDGNPLNSVYQKGLERELKKRGLSLDVCNMILPSDFGVSPVDTKTEVDFFKWHHDKYNKKYPFLPMVIARAPHLERVKLLYSQSGLQVRFASVESLFLYQHKDLKEGMINVMNEYFPDLDRFERAEKMKLIVMKLIDGEGDLLVDISQRFPVLKEFMLTVLGHVK